MKWLLQIIALLLLAACSQLADRTPDQVHQQFITAIRNNDARQEQQVTLPEAWNNVAGIAQHVHENTINPQSTLVNGDPAGSFLGIDVRPVSDRDGAKVGTSVWRYQFGVLCYDTTLVKRDEGWQVLSIYLSDVCPVQAP